VSAIGDVDVSSSNHVASLDVTLLADLDAFYLEHLDSVVEADRVWMTCTCGASISRCADDD
jgi:hypothetical protein